MARTPYATRTYDTPQKGPRVPNVSPSFIVIHHAATLDFDAVINLEMGAREVSSTVIIKDGQVASMFDEAYRAWSLSSQYWDSVSLSSETCNETTSPGWTISEASYATLAKVVADWCKRYGIACNRTQILGHREVYTRYGASYATACPGGIDLDRVVNDANAILNGTPQQEDEMSAEDVEAIKSVVRRESRARLYQNTATGLYMIAKIETGYCRVLSGDKAAQESELSSLKQNGYLEIASEEVAQPVAPTQWDNVIAKCLAARKAITAATA